MSKQEDFCRQLDVTTIEAGDSEVVYCVDLEDPDHKIKAQLTWVRTGVLWVLEDIKVSAEKFPFAQCQAPYDNADAVYKNTHSDVAKRDLFKNPDGCTHVGEMIHFASSCLDEDSYLQADKKSLRFEVITRDRPRAIVTLSIYRDGHPGGGRPVYSSSMDFIGHPDTLRRPTQEDLDRLKRHPSNNPRPEEFFDFYRGAAYSAFFPGRSSVSKLGSAAKVKKRRLECIKLQELRNSCFAFKTSL